ncbi:MAG: hypothetical protein ACRCYI_06520, partial [Plesiomonas shigelloides]
SLISYLLSLISYLLSLISGPFVNRLWALWCCSLLCMMNSRVFAGGRALPFLPLGGGEIAAKELGHGVEPSAV